VDEWHRSQCERALKERYFVLIGYRNEPNATEEISRELSTLHKWWHAIQKELDTNRVSPDAGALV